MNPASAIIVKICPVTSGTRTRMYEATFRRMCAAARRKAKRQGLSILDTDAYRWCLQCGGEVPKELELFG